MGTIWIIIPIKTFSPPELRFSSSMKKPRPHLQQASSWCMLFSGLSIVSFIFIIFFVIVNNEDLKKNPKITTIVPFKPPVELPSPSTKPKGYIACHC